MSEPETKPSPLDEIRAKIAARKAAHQQAREEQELVDLIALDEAQEQHGVDGVATLSIPFTEGLPAMCAARTPTLNEIKRYRTRAKEKNADMTKAAEELASTCLVYPDRETFAKMVAERPAIHAQLGVEAIKLATGKSEAEGKE